MTTTQNLTSAADYNAKADELDAKADLLYLSLLAPSMKEQALRTEAQRLREMAR